MACNVPVPPRRGIGTNPRLMRVSRGLQLPLYIGLIAAQCICVFHFWVELVHLVEAAFGSQIALDKLVSSIGYKPEWLSHVNASVLKVKLATAIIGISSIHLLKTFIHVVFLLSAMAIAVTDKLMQPPAGAKH